MNPLAPALRAVSQLDDPVLRGVLFRSMLLAIVAFAGLAWGVAASLHALFGIRGWIADVIGGTGSALASLYLFLPVAGVIASLYADRVAAAVERRFYPGLPPAIPAPVMVQIWDGVSLGVRVLLLQILALLIAPFLAGLSVPVGWAIAAWAIGRGLFVTVAMRRMKRQAALATYRAMRPAVLVQGLVIAAASLVPILNLVVPVLAIAAMVHVLHERTDRDVGLSLARTVC